MSRRRACAALALAGWAGAAQAAPPRTGEHVSFSRLVFDLPRGVTETVTQENGALVLHLPGAGEVPPQAATLRGLTGLATGKDMVRLTLAPGARPRIWHGGGHVVVDIYTNPKAAVPPPRPGAANTPQAKPDATPAAPPPAGRTLEYRLVAMPDAAGAPPHAPAAGQTAPAQAAPAMAPQTPVGIAALAPPGGAAAMPGASGGNAPASAAAPPAAAPAPPAAAPLAPEDAAVLSNGLQVTRLPSPPEGGGAALLLPFEPGVGAAAYSRGGLAHVVFDDSKPLDLAALRDDPVFASARVRLLPAATELTLKLAPGHALRLQRRAEGWEIDEGAAPPPGDAAPFKLANGAAEIGVGDPASTVVLTDPATGGRLLVGTMKKPGLPVAIAHVSPEFRLCPSWAGVLVDAVSDRLDLRPGKTGFSLVNADGPALAATPPSPAEQALADAGALTRQFDLAPLPVPMLLARLRATLATAASTPKLARFAPRLRAAQDMLALGLAREASAVLRAAVADDPSQASNGRANALRAAADFLSGEQDDPGEDAPPRPLLTGTDEADLWRAIMAPPSTSKVQTAATLAATWRLLLAYPEPLRARLLPVVAEALLAGGQTEAARGLLAKVPDASLDLARAHLLRADGKTDAALVLLDRIAAGADRRQAALATREAIEARLSAGQITPAQAATGLQKRLYAWRDDRVEPENRLRVAALQAQAGQWRDALNLLRESDTLFPTHHAAFRAAERDTIASLLRADSGARMAPLDLVALVEESADLLAEKEASATIAPVLVDKLLALDLPERAEPILAKLMTNTQDAAPKAELGLRVASLALERGDPAMAGADLDASAAEALPGPLAERRAVLRARILAASGHPDTALGLLAPLHSPESLELQARLFELQKAWKPALTALQTLAEATLPAQGALTAPQQELVLRLASAASQAGDMAAMQQLQTGLATRLDPGPRQDLFHALAAQPISTTSDLPRAAREAEAARAVPAALASFEPRPGP